MKISKKLIVAIFLIAIIIAFESLMYGLGRLCSNNPTLLTSNIDNEIPFLSGFIYPYISWFLMLFFVPIVIYSHSSKNFYNYIATIVVTILIAFCIFILFPTTINRPEVSKSNFTLIITNLIFKMDTPPTCCLPSMHCALCFLFILYTINLKTLKPLYKILIFIWSLLVVISTLFIKQHVIFDIFASILVITLAYFICKRFNLYKYVEKIYNKIYFKLSKD